MIVIVVVGASHRRHRVTAPLVRSFGTLASIFYLKKRCAEAVRGIADRTDPNTKRQKQQQQQTLREEGEKPTR